MSEIVWSSVEEFQYNNCACCGIRVENVFHDEYQNTKQPDAGLHINVHTGYAMFTDLFMDERAKSLYDLIFCHDCSLKFVNMLNDELKQIFRGGHPNSMCGDNHENGCEYSWNPEEYR